MFMLFVWGVTSAQFSKTNVMLLRRLGFKNKLPVIFTLVSMLLMASCADKIKTDLIAYEAFDEGLTNSNILINNGTMTALKELDDKLSDPATGEKAKYWMPRAQQVAALSNEMMSYIEGLKVALSEEGSGKSFRKGDKTSVMRVFEKKKKGVELYQHLKTYRDNVLAIDAKIAEAFNQNFALTTKSFDSSADQEQNFTETFFNDIPVVAALSMLSKFENNAKIIEFKTIEFCNSEVGSVDGRGSYSHYIAFAAINSSYVKANEQLEITAGVGSFSKAAQPVITINNRNVPLNYDGVSYYRFNAPGKPGKYTVPVEITYENVDGNRLVVTKPITYTVAGDK
jgi:gliding motility-associated protein GldM